ncbi:uncharacterized protein G2W53_037441 [Senna tora]|uniref:Uncharacterized protein n=1 Tax=Senna tora TaxID=362788 RepID=A0A834SUC1_9FABA|nr:uncharacterized protein G2W53_037441 [Senna tora]
MLAVPPSMMMPNSWILVGGFEALCNFHKVKDTVEAFFYFFQMNFPHKVPGSTFKARGRGPHAKGVSGSEGPHQGLEKGFLLGTASARLPACLVASGRWREEAKHGKTRSADCSESSSAHQTRPRGGSKDEDSKKSRGKGHSSYTGGKGKASASSGSKTSGSAGRRRSHEKGTELRSPSPKRVKVSVPAPESGTRDGSDPSAPGVPAVVATEKHSLTLSTRGSKAVRREYPERKGFPYCGKGVGTLRPEMASLRSSKQLLKVQLENAQKELQRKLIADHNSLLGEYESLLKQFHEAISENTQLKDALDEERETVKALTDDWSGAMEWGWSNCLDQVRFFNPRVDLELRHVNLHHRSAQVAEGAKEKEDSSAHEAVGPEEPLEGPRAKPTVVEPRAMELKPAASSEEFANSILAD